MSGESRYHVRPQELAAYAPANHTGTRNLRLIGAHNVGAERLELVLGEIERGHGASLHAHPGIEQACYLLAGEAEVEVGGERFRLRPGEACFFPPEVPHRFTAVSERVRVLVVYAPPYGERPENVRRIGG